MIPGLLKMLGTSPGLLEIWGTSPGLLKIWGTNDQVRREPSTSLHKIDVDSGNIVTVTADRIRGLQTQKNGST